MESMKSFLAHLARMRPPGGEHDEQVLTWMKQVEELADDCRGCVIVLYLHRGDPEVHRAMGGIQRYVRWFPWFMRKMIDQHQAASRLVELKERARDVSERRKRYDVMVPTKPSSSQATGCVAATGALRYEDDDSDNEAPMATADEYCRRRVLEPFSPVDYCTEKLATWLKVQRATEMECSFASISIVVPENGYNIACDIIHQTLAAYFHRTLWINLADVHHRYSTVTPLDILSIVLREYMGEDEILTKIGESEVRRKIQNIMDNIEEYEKDMIIADEPLSLLHQVLSGILERPWWGPINPTRVAEMLKCYMDEFEAKPSICLHVSQYEYVLRKVFPDPDPSSWEKQRSSLVQGSPPTTLGQDNINGLIHSHKIALEIIKEVFARPQVPGPGGNDSAVREKASSSDSASPIISASKTAIGITNKAIAAAKEAKDKMDDITSLLKEQMMIKGLLDKIERQPKCEHTLIVLQDEMDYISRWKETINALSILPGTSHGPNAVIIITSNNQKAKDYCCPEGEPITLSLVGLYNDIVLQLTSQRKTEDVKDILKIFHDILEKCNPDEFCMKMFAHALYANPNRNYSELLMLHKALDLSKDSLRVGATNNFKKMFKFSYNDLPKDYRSCLLYLAIFPQGYVINRSTIVGRWVTEGLIDKEDWCTSVDHADACFSTLINRWFICAADIGAIGKVKSCVVGGQVHGIISNIAKKERILDTRLSYHLAHHFSIFSGLQLSRSDSMQSFVHNLPEYSPQLPLVKVLHLEGCLFLGGKHSNLKNICNKMLLLKCLSLRGTGVTHLPREINNLQELQILDIRQTSIPPKETRNVLLLKLRRLLAGDTDSNGSGNGTDITKRRQKSAYSSCVSIPYKIEKMENLEVLSNVMASSHGNELKDISRLWELKKLGIVINDNNHTHLLNLLQVIGDLKECLQSISITIPKESNKEPYPSHQLIPAGLYNRLVQPPKVLESVSINGLTNRVRLLSLLARGSNELVKVALCGTMLSQKHLKVLDSLPKLCCIKLRHCAYKDDEFIFYKDELEHLKCLYVDGHNMTDINFKEGAAIALEKIILSSTKVRSLLGVGHLPVLKELELKGNDLFAWFTRDGGAPTELVSPSKNRAAPWESTGVISPSEDEAAAQKGTGVSPLDDLAAPQKKTERKIIFRKGEFQHLEYLVFEDSKMVNIIFENGAAPVLGKIILSMSNNESKLTVSSSLPKLKEIEVKGDKSIFLSLFIKADKISKVSLCDTLLNKGDDIYKLLSEKTSMCCLELLDNSYDESQLTFDKDEFGNLNQLIIKCSNIRNINFHSRSCPNLEKIIWFYNKCDPLDEIQISGMYNIEKLKELQLNGNYVPTQLDIDIKAHKNKPVLRYEEPLHKEDKACGNEHDDAPCFPHFTS